MLRSSPAERNSERQSASAQSVVEFQSVTKRFGELKVLDELNLKIKRCERLAIIGRSGSGKSTLLRLLMMLECLTSGEVLVDGEPLWHMSRKGQQVDADAAHLRRLRRKVVFQQFNLFPNMTPLQNVIVGAYPRPAHEKARREAPRLDLLESVGMAHKTDEHPCRLSGGQEQRVAIARALAMESEIMCFDEVTSALDPEVVGEVLNVLRQLAESGAMTMLFVTHEMRFARDVAHRVAFFDQGKVVEEGPPEQILVRPEHERTQQFLRAVLEER